MKTLSLLALSPLLFNYAQADVARVADLDGDAKIEVRRTIIGTVASVTIYTISAEKVVVVDAEKNVGEVKLTADEKASIDRYLDLLRKERRRRNGSGLYTVRYYSGGREHTGFRERFQIDFPKHSNAKVLTLAQLAERAAK